MMPIFYVCRKLCPYRWINCWSNTNYDMVGVGRTDGKREGEFSAIYFDKTRFTKKDRNFLAV